MFRRSIVVTFAMAAGWLAASVPCQAQRAPQGSYLQSCSNVMADGPTLYARCKTAAGRWESTSLYDFPACVGDINNSDGQLQCNRAPGRRDWERLPRGSYVQTCSDMRVHGNTLTARCQDTRGQWLSTALPHVNQCRGEIVNDDGSLYCSHGPDLPDGTYVQTCAPVYMRGSMLRARCRTADNRWAWTQLDDIAGCRGDISNIDGTLRCNRRDEHDDRGHHDHDRDRHDDNRDRPLPRGSYTQTCQNMGMNGNILVARCKTARGAWTATQLPDAFRCRGDISNVDGNLRCIQ